MTLNPVRQANELKFPFSNKVPENLDVPTKCDTDNWYICRKKLWH